MRKLFTLVVALLLYSASLVAQPSIGLEWDQPNASPTEAQSYIYTYYLDDAAGQILNAVVCGLREGVTVCAASFPSPSIGVHTLSIDGRNEYGVSPKSVPIRFRYPAIPGTPMNLRITREG